MSVTVGLLGRLQYGDEVHRVEWKLDLDRISFKDASLKERMHVTVDRVHVSPTSLAIARMDSGPAPVITRMISQRLRGMT